jgi:hypothetical protein
MRFSDPIRNLHQHIINKSRFIISAYGTENLPVMGLAESRAIFLGKLHTRSSKWHAVHSKRRLDFEQLDQSLI